MLIEHLETLYRKEAETRNQLPHNPFRASRAGHCIRARALDKLGVKGEPLQPRRIAVFKHGDIIHDALTRDIQKALGWRFISERDLTAKHRLFAVIEGVEVEFHPDGAFQNEEQIGIVELKSMADFSFDKAREGEIDYDYLCQAWCYAEFTNFNPVVFIAYRKETSHMVEIVFDRHEKEKIVTQRLGGDAIEIARTEPLLITEIKTPFDLSVEQEVREKFKTLAAVKSIEDLPDGVFRIEPETVKVQGKVKAEELKAKYGEPEQSGSWYAFRTGRKILGFPCSYCSHKSGRPWPFSCYPNAQLEMQGNKPVWVVSDV